jgi:hypothetical protein
MKLIFASIILAGVALTSAVQGQVPSQLSYQGLVAVNGTNFNGNGHFKFALINPKGTVSHWSNDGSSSAGSQPTNQVVIPVMDGLYSVALGDTTLSNMLAISPTVFTNSNVHLRVWFDDGVSGWQTLSPDQPVLSVGYAMMAGQVSGGAIGSTELSPNSVNSGHIINGAVNTVDIADNAISSIKIPDNSLGSTDIADVLALRELTLETAGGLNRIELSGTGDSGVLRMNHGSIGRFLEASGNANGGLFKLYDKLGGELTGQTTVELGSSSLGGYARVYQDNNSAGVHINGQNGQLPGGTVLVYRETGLGVVLQGQRGSGGGAVEVRDSASDLRVLLQGTDALVQLYNPGGGTATLKAAGDDGELVALSRVGVADSVNASVLQASLGRDSNGGLIRTRDENDNTTTLIASGTEGGYMRFYQGGGAEGVVIDGDNGNGGVIAVKDNTGTSTIELFGAQASDTGGRLEMSQANGQLTVILDGEVGNGGGGYLQLRKGDGTATITLDADVSGEGRITTQVLQITGGSDLSEQFDVNVTGNELTPGMVVSIDPANPGELKLSTRAYDSTVAGVVSGAGGVKPGMMMGQVGTVADGKHPVALTGRVYCQVDARYGAIVPGDLITTSDTPGHAMKASDSDRARGAIIGKAMTGLESGRGLVLVLVSLQ